MAVMTSWGFAKMLVEAGVLSQEEVNRTSRIVIDCSADGAVQIYVQRFADHAALAKLAPMLGGMIRAGEETAETGTLEGMASDG